jgi:hypothetical protein
MRDVIWTLIVIWVVYKLYNAFFVSAPKSSSFNSTNSQSNSNNQSEAAQKPKRQDDLSKKLADNEGEYVPFEEIKD